MNFSHGVLSALAAVAALSGTAAAQEASNPAVRQLIEAKARIEVQNDLVFAADLPAYKINDMYTVVELDLGLNLTQIFSIRSELTFEPVLPLKPFKDRYFGGQGGYAEALYLQIQFDSVQFIAGKFHPTFGFAWDKAPGIFGRDFAEDYELSERMGGRGAFTFGDATIGRHTLSGNVFMADRSPLSESIFNNRGQLHLSAGGASNTESMESVSVTLEGRNVPILDGAHYNVGIRHQAPGVTDVASELGFVAGVLKEFQLANDAAFIAIAEGVILRNANTGPENQRYLTLGGELTTGPWIWSASHTVRDIHIDGGRDFTDHLAQVSLAYKVLDNAIISAGYRFSRTYDIDAHIFGLLFAMELDLVQSIRGLRSQ